MATYKKDLEQIKTVADKLLADNACYERLVSCGIKIDFMFAFGGRDDDGKLVGDAIKHHGAKADGLCRIVNLKEQAKSIMDNHGQGGVSGGPISVGRFRNIVRDINPMNELK